jgi:hypothetical protein
MVSYHDFIFMCAYCHQLALQLQAPDRLAAHLSILSAGELAGHAQVFFLVFCALAWKAIPKNEVNRSD